MNEDIYDALELTDEDYRLHEMEAEAEEDYLTQLDERK